MRVNRLYYTWRRPADDEDIEIYLTLFAVMSLILSARARWSEIMNIILSRVVRPRCIAQRNLLQLTFARAELKLPGDTLGVVNNYCTDKLFVEPTSLQHILHGGSYGIVLS